jgi:hypothetical protein
MTNTGLIVAAAMGLMGDKAEAGARDTATRTIAQLGLIKSGAENEASGIGPKFASGLEKGKDVADTASKKFKEDILDPWKKMGNQGETSGKELVAKAVGAIRDGKPKVESAGSNMSNTIASAMGNALNKAMETIKKNMGIYGGNAVVGFGNGFVKRSSEVDTLVSNWASGILSKVKSKLGIHSPSREFMWLADMTLAGFNLGWEQAEDGTLRLVEKTADGIGRAFDPSSLDLSDVDLMQQLVDNMRSQEGALAAQAERMSRIVEEGFDPKVTVDAAFEAIDRIDAGKAAQRRYEYVGARDAANQEFSVTVNLNVPQMVVREEADIELISQRLSQHVDRIVRAQIGRR